MVPVTCYNEVLNPISTKKLLKNFCKHFLSWARSSIDSIVRNLKLLVMILSHEREPLENSKPFIKVTTLKQNKELMIDLELTFRSDSK